MVMTIPEINRLKIIIYKRSPISDTIEGINPIARDNKIPPNTLLSNTPGITDKVAAVIIDMLEFGVEVMDSDSSINLPPSGRSVYMDR